MCRLSLSPQSSKLPIFLRSREFAGEVVKKEGMNGVTSSGEQGVLGAVDGAEFGFDVADEYVSVISRIGDSISIPGS